MSFGRKDLEPGLYGTVIGALAGLVTAVPDVASPHGAIQSAAGAIVGLGVALACRRVLGRDVGRVRREAARAARTGRSPKARLRTRV